MAVVVEHSSIRKAGLLSFLVVAVEQALADEVELVVVPEYEALMVGEVILEEVEEELVLDHYQLLDTHLVE